jgi:prepilin-type N-terminal cleavage/methylation domain-containing protein
MCIAPASASAERRRRRRGRSAFTLLEITMAVAILAMMSLSIYRFVQTNLTALRISAEQNVVDAQFTGFVNLLSAEWSNLPSGVGALQGDPVKLNDRSRDTITWTTTAGPGLMTRYAEGEYLVSMRLRPVSKESDTMEIGFTRTPNTKDGLDNETWVPLLQNVHSLQIRYFDPRLNVWVEKWTYAMTLPRLVKLQIGRTDNPVPWEVIIPLARTAL